MIEGREGAGPSPGRRVPWGFVGMLGLVVAIEWNLSKHDLDFTAPWHWDWRVIGKGATRPGRVRGKDFLFFGDSLVKFGLMPSVIQQRTGKTAYNFALHTGQASSSYFMLRRTLRAGARPSAVVLDLTPHMLKPSPRVNKYLWAELVTTEECLDLSRAMHDADFFARTMLQKVFPSFKERLEIRANLSAALQGWSTSRRFEIPSFRRNWRLNDGAQLMGGIGPLRFDAEGWARFHYPGWDAHPINVEYLERFLALAAERGIPVYWLLPPIHPDVQTWTDASGFDLDYSNFVRATQARFPGTIVVDFRHSGFTADLFIDGAHVNRHGASRLSAALAEILRRPADAITSSRWVTLDIAHVPEFDGPLEDVNESTVVLKAESDAARR
jgi:Protein of unknown function (DUF1574)